MRLGIIQGLLFVLALSCSIHTYAIGPRDRIVPQRPGLPGPKNPIGPNNPAGSNPLSALNAMNPYSVNQTVLRQLLQNAAQKDTQSSNTNLLSTNILGYTASNGYQLLLNNKTPFAASHPIIFERPNPLTPLSNNYTVINRRYYRISHDPANDKGFYSSFNGFSQTQTLGQ